MSIKFIKSLKIECTNSSNIIFLSIFSVGKVADMFVLCSVQAAGERWINLSLSCHMLSDGLKSFLQLYKTIKA